MNEKRKFEPKTPEKFHRLVESGEEILIAGAGQEGSIKIADGDIVSDDVYNWKVPVVRKCVDRLGNHYGRAFMLVKDKFGLMYLLKHRLEYNQMDECFHSFCTAFDVVSDSELSQYEKLCVRHGWNAPHIEPIQIISGGKEIKDLGQLWLLENHHTKLLHKAKKLTLPKQANAIFNDANPDVYLSLFMTQNYAYDRGIGKNTMGTAEQIIARLNPDKPKIKFVGAMQPLDLDQTFKRKMGDRSLEMIDEYGERHLDDCYCAIASVYQKLGFTVTPMTKVEREKDGMVFVHRATLLQKEINPNVILQDPNCTVSKHFANPLDEEDIM